MSVNSRDKDLFAASTKVIIGDENLARFWQSSWVDGRTLKNIAPTLYKKAKMKNLSVRKALQDNRWISHITPLSTAHEIREYVMLWEAVGKLNSMRTGKTISGGNGWLMGNTQQRVLMAFNSKDHLAN